MTAIVIRRIKEKTLLFPKLNDFLLEHLVVVIEVVVVDTVLVEVILVVVISGVGLAIEPMVVVEKTDFVTVCS